MTQLTYTQLTSLKQFKPVEKLFYKKFPFRATLSGETLAIDKEDDSYFSKMIVLNTLYYKKINPWLTNEKIVHKKRSDYSLFLYFLNLEDFSKFYNEYVNLITKIEGPINENQATAMNHDLSIVVRKNLFYKDYTYKLEFNCNRNELDLYTELDEFCRESLSEGDYRYNFVIKDFIENTYQKTYYPYWSKGALYLKNYDDLCTLHIMFKSRISETKKVLLTSDLE